MGPSTNAQQLQAVLAGTAQLRTWCGRCPVAAVGLVQAAPPVASADRWRVVAWPCWATPPTPCGPTWPRAPAWRSRTRRRWRSRWPCTRSICRPGCAATRSTAGSAAPGCRRAPSATAASSTRAAWCAGARPGAGAAGRAPAGRALAVWRRSAQPAAVAAAAMSGADWRPALFNLRAARSSRASSIGIQ
jgi:hypothetical protein